MDRLMDGLERTLDALKQGKLPEDKTFLVGSVLGGAAGLYTLGSIFLGGSMKIKPGSIDLAAGTIDRGKIKDEFTNYWDAYGTKAGEGIKDDMRDRTPELVDTFYNLVTDIYEWGWGQSFHFSPHLPGKDQKASEAVHEGCLPALLHIKPGDKVLDCGCGVGGPMRTIAARSGAHVTGITINDYQVMRAKFHNRRLGLQNITDVVEGNFLQMPFEEGTFHGAYAIEATCHAPKLEQVYGEVYRVLRPGAYFATYEWVATKYFDPKNADHVRIIDEINIGNGLPEMRTWKEAEDAGKQVGFELVMSVDMATASPVCGPWYDRLRINRFQHHINHYIVSVLTSIRLAPKGMKEVHKMLVDVAHSLVRGGETGIFTPMHLLLFRKPLAAAAKKTNQAKGAAADTHA